MLPVDHLSELLMFQSIICSEFIMLLLLFVDHQFRIYYAFIAFCRSRSSVQNS
jgi:hypothetical protein